MFFKKDIITNVLHHSGVTYPVPSNITYWWNFGVLALVFLGVQIITGIFLAMHFVPNADLAFISVESIMRDIEYGWLLRYAHANGASMFFLVVYVHLFRGLYYGSYNAPRQLLWCTGVIILIIMILTAFLGYVLPWGQMSFWAATVITNLVSAIPYIGNDLLIWLWGGFAMDNPTLNRFFSLHYLFPFILTGFVGIHLVYLHENGSNNALGVIFNGDKIPFTPYFTIKDILGVLLCFIFFAYLIFFEPVILGHPDNFMPANPLVTPNHIVPEWYFLPFYAILRTVPHKLVGLTLLTAAIIVLLVFPFFCRLEIASGYLRPVYRLFFWLFFFDCLLLGWIGGKFVDEPFYTLGQVFTIYYFCHFLIILPVLSYLEKQNFERSMALQMLFAAIFGPNRFADAYFIPEGYFKNFSKPIDKKLTVKKKQVKTKSKLFVKDKIKNLNKKYTTQEIDSFAKNGTGIAQNTNAFFRGLLCILILMQGPLLFNDGDRIPNITILLVMFFGYLLFTKQDLFAHVLTLLGLLWKKWNSNLRAVIFSKKIWVYFNVAILLIFIKNLISIKNIKQFFVLKIKNYYLFFIFSYSAYLFILLRLVNTFQLVSLKQRYVQQLILKK